MSGNSKTTTNNDRGSDGATSTTREQRRPPPVPTTRRIHNPYAPMMNRTGAATTTATNSTTTVRGAGGNPSSGGGGSNINNNHNNRNNLMYHNNNSNNSNNNNQNSRHLPPLYDDGLSQVQPVSFTQAFGDNNDDDDVNDPQQQHASSCSTTTTTTTNTTTTERRRVGHELIAKHVLGVSTRQKGNPILDHIRNVPFQYFEIVPDYIMGPTSCALFLSLKYHRLYQDYIHRRLAELGKDFKLRILLVLVDVSDNADLILQLNRIGVVNNLTVVLAWSEAEAGRYLETYKAYDGKDASSIQKRESNHIVDQMQDFWTACKPVNKTDAASLWEHFGNLKNVVKASRDEWALVSGLGPIKIQRLYEALHKPFSSRATRKRKRRQREDIERAEKKKKEQEEQQEQQQQEEEPIDIGEVEQGKKEDPTNLKTTRTK